MVKLVGEDARDLHVVALGVSAGDVFHGNVGVGRGALLPVARRVGAFHADAELAAFGRGRSCFLCRVVCVLRGRRRARAAGGEGKQHEGCEQGSDGSSEVHGVASFLNGNWLRGGSRPFVVRANEFGNRKSRKCSRGAFTANDLQYRQNRKRPADSSIALHKL